MFVKLGNCFWKLRLRDMKKLQAKKRHSKLQNKFKTKAKAINLFLLDLLLKVLQARSWQLPMSEG